MASFQGYIPLILLGFVPFILVRALFTRYSSKARCGRRPPGPPSLPLIGNFHLLLPLPHQALHRLSATYGPMFQIFLGGVPCVVVSSPEITKEFLTIHESSFSRRSPNATVRYLSYKSKGFVFAPYGPYWKFMRKLCMSQLLGGRTLDVLRPVRRSQTMSFLRVMLNKGLAGEAVDVGHELLTLSNGVISRMIMSRSSSGNDDEAQEIRKLVIDMVELIGKFNLSDFIWFLKYLNLQYSNKNLKKLRHRFDVLMEEVIKEHQDERRKKKKKLAGEERQISDLLDILLDIHDDETSEIKISIDNIKAFILDLFLAGSDTSALTTVWAVAELINHPHVMKKAREEIDSVVGKTRIVEESDLINLPYLQAIFKETIRIHPAVPLLGRISSESCNVCGYEFLAKTLLLVNLWAMGRDPKIWEDPLEFRPERFMMNEEEGRDLDVRGQQIELIPFGAGRRSCPGVSLAQQIVKTNLAAMIQCFDWKVINNNGGKVDMEEKPSLTLSRAHPIICVPVPRLDPFPCIM